MQAATLYSLQKYEALSLLGSFLDEHSARRLIMSCIPAVNASSVDQILEVFASDACDAARFGKKFIPPSSMLVRVPGAFLTSHGGVAEIHIGT